MKKRSMLVLLMFCVMNLTGCALTSQVEDQAYVLVMGLDRTEDGQLEMTVQIPRISGSTNEGNSGSGDENYMQMSVKAADFEGALEKLDWASPRNVNLAQMKLIVVSQALAKEAGFRQLIANIAQTERLFTATKVAVCEEDAKEFVSAIRPYIGTRISTDIEAMFDHYNDCGYVPESSLADLYYQTESVYSDPMVTYALLNQDALQKQEEKKSTPASAFLQSVRHASETYESEIPTRYLGAAVFSQGSMKCMLNGGETILANLLRNELDTFRYECNGQSLEFVPTRPVRLSVDTDSKPAQITINIALSYAAQERTPDETLLKAQLKDDIETLIRTTQNAGVEPFGLAEKAAKNFLTLSDWVDYNWRIQYSNAEIMVQLRFAQSDA